MYEFQCFRCRWVKTEPEPFHSRQTLCTACRRAALPLQPPTTEWHGRPVGWQPPPAPPPMRDGSMPHAAGVSVMLVMAVFLIGVVVGTKMAGGC